MAMEGPGRRASWPLAAGAGAAPAAHARSAVRRVKEKCFVGLDERQTDTERTKWRQAKGQLSTDTMVVVKEDNLPPLKWKLGRIVSVIPGSDGINRVADIRTSSGIIRRAFSKICPLPVEK
ncbi:uncharacterized protein LOC134656776 isoform X2 [Cydia amplana]|uniref:uncharacterized protein LOC134656776 isoform X2 n=1 Tax=Cydia amplana TaxID=1869771 RepID=UPI002FE55D79